MYCGTMISALTFGTVALLTLSSAFAYDGFKSEFFLLSVSCYCCDISLPLKFFNIFFILLFFWNRKIKFHC